LKYIYTHTHFSKQKKIAKLKLDVTYTSEPKLWMSFLKVYRIAYPYRTDILGSGIPCSQSTFHNPSILRSCNYEAAVFCFCTDSHQLCICGQWVHSQNTYDSAFHPLIGKSRIRNIRISPATSFPFIYFIMYLLIF